MKAWKNTEIEVARLLNGKRLERTNYGKSQPDVITDKFVVECKSRKTLPVLFLKAWKQVLGYIKEYKDKIPIVIFHQSRKRGYGKYFVIIELSDFLKLLNKGDK